MSPKGAVGVAALDYEKQLVERREANMRSSERIFRRALVAIPLAGLALGLAAIAVGRGDLASPAWALGTAPVIASLAVFILRDLRAGRMGVDPVALISMAAALALGQTLAGVVVALMYSGGSLLEDFAVTRAERDLKALLDRTPRIAHRKTGDTVEDAPVGEIAIGDAILVRAGEVVPIDGQVTSGSALIDEAALTGEPIPVIRRRGEFVSSGTINAGETVEIQATATAGDSAYAGIVRMVTEAQTTRAPFVRVADRYALLLVPVALGVAGAAWWFSGDPVRGLAVLVAATPCPLILAAPAAFIGGTSQAARRGILVKGGEPIEALARVQTVMFDKTGTLTVGGARLVAIETGTGIDPDEALRLAASLEQASHHVLAAAIVGAARDKGLSLQMPTNVREVLGSGVEGVVEGIKVGVGSLQFIKAEERLADWARRALRRAFWRSALAVLVALDESVVAVLLFADELRRETPRAIQSLRAAGVSRIAMVTGDRKETAEAIGAALDLDAVLADRTPADKVGAVVAERQLAPTLMVGDGINDAPALAAANVGMAMGARGASASSEAADAVILVERLDRVPEAVAIARRTRSIALQSIIAGMGMSGATMAAAAIGYVTPIAGALIQEAIDVAVILNSLRALTPSIGFERPTMSEAAADLLREDHEKLEKSLDRLRQIADALDTADAATAVDLILQANLIAGTVIAQHEREDERTVYPGVSKFLKDRHGLSAMSRAHREILQQARLLSGLADVMRPNQADPLLIRDAQRMIETIESLVHIHNAQEEDIYEHAAATIGGAALPPMAKTGGAVTGRGVTEFEKKLEAAPRARWVPRILVGVFAIILASGVYFGAKYLARFHPGAFLFEKARGPVTAPADISATNAIPINAEVSGTIEAVYCDIGSFVKAGQICAKIDARPYSLIVGGSREAVEKARSRMEKAEAKLARSQAVYDRKQQRSKRGSFITRARKALEQAQAHAAHEKTALAVARAALRAAESDLKNTEARSLIDGAVISRTVRVGQEVLAGQSQPLFVVASDLGVVNVTARVDRKTADAFRPGDEVSFSLGTPERKFQGAVTQISQPAKLVDAAKDYDIVMRTSNPDLELKPGASVTIRISNGHRGASTP